MAETSHGDPIDPTDPYPEPMGPRPEGHYHYNDMRSLLFSKALDHGELSGMPYPHKGQDLVFSKAWNPNLAESLLEYTGQGARPNAYIEPSRVFWSTHRKARVGIYHNVSVDGRRYVSHKVENRGEQPADRFSMQWQTSNCDHGWGVYEEKRAMSYLKKLLRNDPEAYRQYWMCGMFSQEGRRSNLIYVFRKLRPTVVVSGNGSEVKILCTLCTHPVSYYAGTFAGGMCPTDDVITHLTMMWTDEHMYWKKCRQHSPDDPASGI